MKKMYVKPSTEWMEMESMDILAGTQAKTLGLSQEEAWGDACTSSNTAVFDDDYADSDN